MLNVIMAMFFFAAVGGVINSYRRVMSTANYRPVAGAHIAPLVVSGIAFAGALIYDPARALVATPATVDMIGGSLALVVLAGTIILYWVEPARMMRGR
jgi:hypothetical protein